MSGTSPYIQYTSPTITSAQSPSPNQASMTTTFSALGASTPTRGRPRGAFAGTGLKRGRKPRGSTVGTPITPHLTNPEAFNSTSTATSTSTFATTSYSQVHWALPNTTASASTPQTTTSTHTTVTSPTIPASTSGTGITSPPTERTSTPTTTTFSSALSSATVAQLQALTQARTASQQTPTSATQSTTVSSLPATYTLPSGQIIDVRSLLSNAGVSSSAFASTSTLPAALRPTVGADEDGEGDDELLPAMADDDYSAQLSFQSQSKDNLKVLMDNFSPAQYDRFEAYRRHALPKQAVRKVIQQTLGQQVSQPVAQIVAGFSKVFVGEIVEKARAVQERRGDTGPLSPDHLREAYRMYQEETGRVGAARPLRSKRLFVR